ncbi:SIMPL domain-containing protein [Kaarinaea lacus]
MNSFSVDIARAKEETLPYDRVHLSTSASTQVENDTLVTILYAQREGTKLPALTNEVNKLITAAVKHSKQIPEIDVQTLGYQTNPVYDKQRLSSWRVRQSIRLKSQDSAKLSQLIGELQSTLAVESINYSISPGKLRETEDKLITEAIGAFTQRAKLITGQFGRNNYRLVEININTAGVPVRPMPMRGAVMAMEAAVAPPTIEAGKQEVQITVSGTIEMQLE